MNDYSTVDPRTGSANYNGPSEIRPGDHSHMPSRTSAYLPTDDRGHIQASSLGGSNGRENVVPQSADLNRSKGAYYNMERAERSTLKDGAEIHSDKTAFASNQPGQRPDAFIVNDQITYADGQTQNVHLSFANLTNSQQAQMNAEVESLPVADTPNPGDGLRDSMSPDAYGELMAETDSQLPSISDEYAEADYSGVPASAEAWDSGFASDTDFSPTADCDGASTDAGCDSDAGADAGADSDPD